MANQETAIAQAVASGDAAKALDAYGAYVKSMEASGQKPKSPKDLGIK